MTRKRLFIIKGKAKWLKIDKKPKTKLPEGLKEDLTVDGYIKKYGSIEFKNKRYDTKQGYMNAIKEAGMTIKDW